MNFLAQIVATFSKQKEKIASSIVRILTAVCIGCAIVLSGYMLASRFFHLTNGLQYDELYSAITASPLLPWGYVWKNMILQDINLPLFNLMLFGWNRIFPFTQEWMHLFSALWSAATVLVAWWLAPRYWTGLKKGIFVSLIACSFILSSYGAIIRTYSFSVFLSTIFSLLALRFIHKFMEGKNPSIGAWIFFFVTGLLGVYSHYFCTALFFITALILFAYACYYKVGRAWSFFGTAVVFGLWGIWLFQVFSFSAEGINGLGSSWWYATPFAKATFEILTFLLGSQNLFLWTMYATVFALISFFFTYKTKIFKQTDMMLPLLQIIILLVVVAVISIKVNLWMDRYFLPVMPSIILIFAEGLDHLRKRHAVLLILWPMLLVGWVKCYFTLEHLLWPEYTGLKAAFSYITEKTNEDKILVDMTGFGYPLKAIAPMLSYYVPQDHPLQILRLTKETLPLALKAPKTLVLMPLCSQIHLINTSVEFRVETDTEPLLFGKDICIFTFHSIDEGKK